MTHREGYTVQRCVTRRRLHCTEMRDTQKVTLYRDARHAGGYTVERCVTHIEGYTVQRCETRRRLHCRKMCDTHRRLHYREMRDTQKVTLQLGTTPSTPMREWSQSSSYSYSINSKTNIKQRTLALWRSGCAHSYCNWLVSKHDTKIGGSVQAWLHAFLNW